jgi:hypothetical protein
VALNSLGSGQLGSRLPGTKTIHLFMDNLNIHSQKSLTDVFGAEMAAEVWNHFTVHCTLLTAVG